MFSKEKSEIWWFLMLSQVAKCSSLEDIFHHSSGCCGAEGIHNLL